MKDTHTDITIVLDRSGSMASVAGDTIGGFNRFLEDQQKAPGTACITLHQFDHEFETRIKAQDIAAAPKLTPETFVPRGNTALLDAIGRAIVDTGARLGAMPEAERAGKVVFVIITDGYENASVEYNRGRIHEMITHQTEKYAWEFVFLGANQNAIATAGSVGIVASKAMTFADNSEGTTAAFCSVSSNLRAYRSGSKFDMAYEPGDREAQAKAGVTQ